jgi:hypothetical protein
MACTDRVKARDFVTFCHLEPILVPLLGIYDQIEDLPWDSLPRPYIIKCSHASSFNAIIKSKEDLDKPQLIKQFTKWQHTNYGKLTCEPHYKKIKSRLVVEQLLYEDDHLPIEYKIHVFNGVPKYVYVVSGRGSDIRYDNYLIDWTPFEGAQFNGWHKSDKGIIKPNNWDEMVNIAKILGATFPFVRVDLFNIKGHIYFNELTFTPAKGTLRFDDDKVDFEMGTWLDINTK